MGKMKRAREKAHNAAVKSNANKNTKATDTMETKGEPQVPLAAQGLKKSDLFKGLDMGKFNFSLDLPDFDARSTVSSKSLKHLNLKKKEKQKMRREMFLKKMDAVEAAKKQAKIKSRKNKTPVVGDIGALGDALPTLELLLKEPTGPRKEKEEITRKGIQKENKRKKQMNDDIAVFQQVIKHPAFKSDPAKTISEHLHNKQKLEEMDT